MHLECSAELAGRHAAIRSFARTIRVSEYHVTNSCNLRCKGCWFFANELDHATREDPNPDALRRFIAGERARGVNTALLIGGEPLLFPDRIQAYVEGMEYVSVSTNGMRRLPREGFERVQLFVTVFGGGDLDDELRAIRPGGKRFTGLFETALQNVREDPRATFIVHLAEQAISSIEPTVERIADNGNRVTLGLYSAYDEHGPVGLREPERLIDEALRVKERFPDVVLNTPYYLKAIVTGEAHFGRFGYESCPSISVDHPAHAARLSNGNRTLPLFNAYAPDLRTVHFCCTSGCCETCRDSQAVWSWLLVNGDKFEETPERLREWVELAEGYWGQFVWSPVRPAGVQATADCAVG